MKLANLTLKQEKFINELVKGKTQRQAYIVAYPGSENWKPNSIDINASNLFKKPKVRLRYEQLVQKHRDKALWTREQAVEELKWLVEMAKADLKEKGFRQANSSSMINAIKELNEMESVGKERELKVKKLESEIIRLEGSEASIEKLDEILESIDQLSKGDG